MQLKLKRCSGCDHWSPYTTPNEDGILVSTCGVNYTSNSSLGLSNKTTRGSDTCSKWTKKKPKAEFFDIYF